MTMAEPVPTRPTPSDRARLSDTGAIIVTHRRAELARACAERVLDEIEPENLVIVVNDPENAPRAELEWLKTNVGHMMLNETVCGYATNVNAGVRHFRGQCRYYLILNDDVLLEPGSIAAMRTSLDARPGAAVTGPLMTNRTGVRQPVAYRFPTIGSELASALILPARFKRRLASRFIVGGNDGSPAWLLGAILLVRASAFAHVDGFDEGFFLYAEETDLMRRLADSGWSAFVCHAAEAVHLGAESTADRRYRRLLGLSRWKYVRKHWRRRDRVALSALLALAQIWNSCYVLGRIMFAPRSVRAKLSLWAAHWDSRTAPRFQPSRGSADG
jgi:N-acetylglucosaminyl-diphospho-decaprenol L-rhamnosyltransferase